MRFFRLAIVITILSACETFEMHSLSDTLNGWMYSDINDYISANGYPTNSVELPNGNMVYTFYRTRGDWWCKTNLEVRKNIIVSWGYEGNSCH